MRCGADGGRNNRLSQSTIDLLKPILLGYSRAMDADLVEAMRRLLTQPDAAILQWVNDERGLSKDQFNRPMGQWPVPYSLPLLSSHIGELDLLSVDQQECLLRVNAELILFNEQVAYVRHLVDRTFTASGPNHQLNDANLVSARRTLDNRGVVLIRAINRVLESVPDSQTR